MKLTEYFIKHPVMAVVLNCMIILVGILSFYSLKIREYPEVEFPNLTVKVAYPNASAELVESSVTNILEDKIAGVEGVESLTSETYANLSLVRIIFRTGTPIDRALMAVKDAVSAAKSEFPPQVREPAIERNGKRDGPPFMSVCFESSLLEPNELTHYANVNLKNSFRSINGVSSVEVWGSPYAYRVTLDSKKMYNFGVNADEIYSAIERNSSSLPLGRFQNEIAATLVSKLETVEDFENIIVKAGINSVLLKYIAKVELVSDDQQARVKVNGNPGVCMGISRASDANPLDVSREVHQQVAEIQHSLPSTMKMEVIIDQAEFIRSSLNNIKNSIIEAILLVLVIVFIFLRNFRATLIPLITIPISLIGSLLLLKICGFSINIMTLLAMTLSVGLVVDDAIIVLENISRYLEQGESPLNAAIKGSKEIGFAIVAMTFTLTSVYAPIAFINGVTGQLFIEFAASLAGSVLISGIVAITLSPLMCSRLLKTKQEKIFPKLDMFFNKLADNYSKSLKFIMTQQKILAAFIVISIVVIAIVIKLLPSELAPKEDRGLIGVFVSSVAEKDINFMEEKLNDIENILKATPEAKGSVSFLGNWGGNVALMLQPLEERKHSAAEIVNELRPRMMALPSIDAYAWNWDAGIPGFDNAFNGSDLVLSISSTDSYQDLFKAVDSLKLKIEENKLFADVSHDLKLNQLKYDIELDKNIFAKLGLSQQQVARMIETFFSGNNSLDFKKDGILYSINIKGDFNPWSLSELYVTNLNGKRISIGSFGKMISNVEPQKLLHYNQMRSVKLSATLLANDNFASAMDKLYSFADDNLPKSYKKDWLGMAKTYNETSNVMLLLFMLALVFIYAILAVQFENFIDPLIILFTVPLACSGALIALYLTHGSLNIYSEIGIITLIGLITKHGILIVEFANQLRSQGSSLLEAIERSSVLRLRPILMTTAAMICGAIPLIFSSAAGYEARYQIGIVLVGGLSFGTVFTLFILPSLYYGVYSANR